MPDPQREYIEFGVDRHIMRHLITSQAGSLDKAVLEALSNALDAGARSVRITLADLHTIVIEDDGRGFTSRTDIEKHFATFGFDHDTADEQALGRKIGRFGLGRGQILAFAQTLWETNQFSMEVEIRTQGLGFTLTEHEATRYRGCRITAKLYTPMTRVTRARMAETLAHQIRHAAIDVSIDGQPITVDPHSIAWTTETETFRFRERPHATSGVDVYNLGVFVARYPHDRMGVSGELVSRPGHAFRVNMARNDVLQGECPVWAEAVRVLAGAAEARHRHGRTNDADRAAIAQALLWEQAAAADYVTRPIFKNVFGRQMTPRALGAHARGRITVAPRAAIQAGEHIHDAHLAAVLAPAVCDWWTARDAEHLAKRLSDVFATAPEIGCKGFRAIDFASTAKRFAGAESIVGKAQWTKTEQAAVAGLITLNDQFTRATRPPIEQRAIMLGTSALALAWTDGAGFIAFDRTFVSAQLRRGMNGWLTMLHVLVHEYTHDTESRGEHLHGPEFHRAVHDRLVHRRYNGFSLAMGAITRYRRVREKVGLKDTIAAAHMLDRIDEVSA